MPRRKQPNSILKQFGENVKNIRTEANLSQEELGILVGLHRTTIGELERGEQNITLINLTKLAAALGCACSDLLVGMKPKPMSPAEIKKSFSDEVDRIMKESNLNYVKNKNNQGN